MDKEIVKKGRSCTAPENCIDCGQHEVIHDPDPTDSFNDDDMAVVCKLAMNPARDVNHRYLANRHPQRSVTMSCRPYNLRKESDRPDWCPLAA